MPRVSLRSSLRSNGGLEFLGRSTCQAGEIALRKVEAGVDAVGIHLQSEARRANPKLIEDDYLGDEARAVFERIGKAVPV
jgi:hypothetical protein